MSVRAPAFGHRFGHWLGLWLVVASGCGGELPWSGSEPVPTSDLRPGLVLRGGDFATREDHLVEMVVHEGHVYVANSNLGVAAMSLDDDGGVTLTDAGTTYEELHRCTTLAVYAPTDTLYCGSEAPSGMQPGSAIDIYDISTPGRASWRERFPIEGWSTRDIEVVGSRLLIHHFDDGLWTADIDADGQLSNLSKTPLAGNARFSVALGDRLVTLLDGSDHPGSDLVLLDAASFEVIARLGLRGPPLGLSADAEGLPRVAVGLGSAGMAIVSVVSDGGGEILQLERILEPPAVVTHGLLSGDLAVAVTLSGAFAWQLSDATPRMFGFGPAAQLGFARAGNMLHGLLHDGELLTSDWLWVERWSIDPSGEVLDLDVPRGIYLPPEGGVHWRMRNPGEQSLRVELWSDRSSSGPSLLGTFEVGAGELVEVALTAEQRRAVLPADVPSSRIIVRVYDPEIPSEGEPSSSTILVLAQREPGDPLPPAVGEPFPPIELEDIEHQRYSLPTPAGSQTIWFWPDCALMWPQIEDLAWLVREGIDLGRGDPVLLTDYDVAADGFVPRWNVDALSIGMWGVAAPGLGGANDWIDEADIYRPFFIEELPGDAMPTDYVIDGDGTIRSIERMYRGVYTLVVPGPWE